MRVRYGDSGYESAMNSPKDIHRTDVVDWNTETAADSERTARCDGCLGWEK